MRRLRQLVAIMTLTVIVGGVPWLFAVTIGNPLHGWKDLSAGDLSGTVVIDVLAAVVWIAWAQFAVSVLVEAYAAVRHAPLPSHIPGVFDAQQQLARRLVAAALLVGTLAATVAWAPGAWATPAPPVGAAPTSVSSVIPPAHRGSAGTTPVADRPSRSTSTGPATWSTVYVVPAAGQGPDTLWDIAETRLGAGERWHEIWALNDGRTQADGTVMTDPGLLRPGWTVLVPQDTPPPNRTAVPVVPGDTLTEIADQHDSSEPAVWELNRGRIMSDGRRFTDPDLIKPGDTIFVPATAGPSVTSPSPPSTPTPHRPPPTPPSPPPTHGPPSSSPSASDPPPSSTPPASDPATATPGSASGTTSPHVPASTATAGAAQLTHAAEHADLSVAAYLAVLGGGAALLAGVLYAALRRYRRRQLRHRPAGHTPAPTSPHLRNVDAAVHIAGTPALSTVDAIDRALRVLHHPEQDVSQAGGKAPALLRLTVEPSAIHLQFADHPPLEPPPPPEPWTAVDIHTWQANRADVNRLTPMPDIPAPYPTLVSAVHDGDRETLLHLAQFGVLAVTGDGERAANWLRFVTGELAHNRWSDQLTVTLAGLEPELVALNPARLAHTDDVAGAIRALHITDDCPEVLILGPGWHDDPEGRAALVALLPALADPARPGTGPVVLAYLPDDTTHDADVTLARSGADQPATPIPGSTRPLWVHIDADGILTATDPTTGLDLSGPAAQLPAAHAADLAARLAEVRGTDSTNFVPLPPLTPPRSQDESAPDEPAPIPPDEVASSRPVDDQATPAKQNSATRADTSPAEPTSAAADLAAPDTTSMLTASNLEYLTRSATTAADLHYLAPSIQLTVAASLDHDTNLDADLTAWRDPHSPQAKLHLLGPVTLTAHGRVPDGRIAFYTEVVTYLALHSQGVSGDRFAADLWPDRELTGRDSSPKNALSIVRKWLGVDPMTGVDYLPAADTAGPGGVPTYRLSGLLVDWDLFRRLRTRAQARGPDGVADLIGALDLVTGEPLAQRRLDGYGWLRDGTTVDEDALSVAIIDVAHTVATAALADGDTATAQHAVDVALSVGPADDRPLLDQAAVLDAQGRHAELAATVRRIRAHHEAEVEEDLPPRTYEILLRHGWLAG